MGKVRGVAGETNLFTWGAHFLGGIGHHLKLQHGQLNHNFKVRGPPNVATPGRISRLGN